MCFAPKCASRGVDTHLMAKLGICVATRGILRFTNHAVLPYSKTSIWPLSSPCAYQNERLQLGFTTFWGKRGRLPGNHHRKLNGRSGGRETGWPRPPSAPQIGVGFYLSDFPRQLPRNDSRAFHYGRQSGVRLNEGEWYESDWRCELRIRSIVPYVISGYKRDFSLLHDKISLVVSLSLVLETRFTSRTCFYQSQAHFATWWKGGISLLMEAYLKCHLVKSLNWPDAQQQHHCQVEASN